MQALTNGDDSPVSTPYMVTMNSAAYTGQISAWNWESTYRGGGTVGGMLTSVRPGICKLCRTRWTQPHSYGAQRMQSLRLISSRHKHVSSLLQIPLQTW